MTITARLRRITRRQWVIGGIAVLVLAAVLVLYRYIDVDAVHARAEKLNGPMVFALVTLLPLLGFPITIAHAVAGVRFGIGPGLALVSLSILLQLLISYGLVHLFRDVFARKLRKVRRQLPEGANGPVTLFTVLLPGVPYFAKNYVIPVMGVPLRTFLLWAFPVHVARSSIAIFFGDKSDDLTPGRIVFFVVYGIVVTAACAWTFRRLRGQLRDRSRGADDRKRAA